MLAAARDEWTRCCYWLGERFHNIMWLCEMSKVSVNAGAGLEFFPGFLNADRRATVDRAALEYSRLGRYPTEPEQHPKPLPGYIPLALGLQHEMSVQISVPDMRSQCNLTKRCVCRQQMKMLRGPTAQIADLLLERPQPGPLLLQDAEVLAAASSSTDTSAATDAPILGTLSDTSAGVTVVLDTLSATLSSRVRSWC